MEQRQQHQHQQQGRNDAEKVKATQSSSSYDIFRDSPLRFLGYANEIGESFRYQFPKLVVPSYVVAFGYCTADAATSGYNAWSTFNTTKNEDDATMSTTMSTTTTTTRTQSLETTRATLDTLLWQCFASVTIPGVTINLIVKASRWAVRRSPIVLPALVMEWLPTATGLCSIPVIVKPIDATVDYAMDRTFRQIWQPMNSTSAQQK